MVPETLMGILREDQKETVTGLLMVPHWAPWLDPVSARELVALMGHCWEPLKEKLIVPKMETLMA